jgi:hypothetical protein
MPGCLWTGRGVPPGVPGSRAGSGRMRTTGPRARPGFRRGPACFAERAATHPGQRYLLRRHTGLDGPDGVAADAATGDLYVAMNYLSADRIAVYNSSGTI